MINNGSIFLFSDVLIIAKCVLAARRYFAEIAFSLNNDSFSTKTAGAEIMFKEKENVVTTVEFEDDCLAQSWDEYIQFARSRQQFIPTKLKVCWTIIHGTVFNQVGSDAPSKKSSSFKSKSFKSISLRQENSVRDLINRFAKEVGGENNTNEIVRN